MKLETHSHDIKLKFSPLKHSDLYAASMCRVSSIVQNIHYLATQNETHYTDYDSAEGAKYSEL